MLAPAGLEKLFIEYSIPASEYKLPQEEIETDLEKLFTLAAEYGVEVLE